MREETERAGARLRRRAALIEAHVDRFRWAVKRRMGWIEPLQILPYRGYGNGERLWVQGRVLEAKALMPAAPEDRRWRNFRRMVRRLSSDEIPGARVRLTIDDRFAETRTDEEGYFTVRLEVPTPPQPRPSWRNVRIELLEPLVPRQGPVIVDGEFLVPGTAAEHVVVSDIDDTVIQTHVTQLFKMLRVTMLGNALTRLPFAGTTELFGALVRGPTGQGDNPVFYLSRSPYNLYDLLVDFLDRHGLPRGPLLLRDIGLHAEGTADFKRDRLRELLEMYPTLPFVLIGDSGQHDPELYLQIACEYPGRVRAIYIRDVGRKRHRPAVATLVQEAFTNGTEMLLVTRAEEALVHARSHGLAL